MKKITWIIIAAAIVIGGYTYYSNEQAKELARVEAVAAEKAAADAKAIEEAAAAAQKTAEEEAAKATEEAAAEAKRVADEAAAKVAEEAAAAAKAAEEAAEEAAAAAKKAADEAAAKAAEAAAAAENATSEGETAMMLPFGSQTDVGFAKKVWQAMLDQKLAGPEMLRAVPYEGTDPHGMMLELFVSNAVIDGHRGDLIVKRNFGPEGVAADQVLADPAKHLGAITVMFRREAGYDDETKNWFWAKFLPDGSLDKNPKGMSLAGKVAKGMDAGCIACHSNADGDDFVFSPGVFE